MYKLSKKNLLHKNSQFQHMYAAGKSYANRMMVVYVLPKAVPDRHVGFAAGKRLGGAVVRNRVKRLLREVYRLNQSRLISDADFIFVGRKAMTTADLSAVNRAFEDLCKRARILAK